VVRKEVEERREKGGREEDVGRGRGCFPKRDLTSSRGGREEGLRQ
jgi:hypothetical protein